MDMQSRLREKSKDECFICSGKLIPDSGGNAYVKCSNCGHEILRENKEQKHIINDILSEEEISRFDILDRFRKKMLDSCSESHDFLLDIGSASGKFLYNNKDQFGHYAGIEITPECIRFSSEVLKLNIKTSISEINEAPTVVTFWHSLEHLPEGEINRIFSHISNLSDHKTGIIVSVPNNNSLQYKLFAEDYAFYDLPNHIHQFSSDSLNRLLETFGFDRVHIFRSYAYNIFGYLQGFMNKCNVIHNYLYSRKKRGLTFNMSRESLFFLDLYNYVLALFFSLPAIIFSIYDSVFLENGGVITSCYSKRKK